MDSRLFTFDILTVPSIYWLLVMLGMIVHVCMKLLQETTEATFAKYVTSGRNQIMFFLSFVQSSGMLIAGWMAYAEAKVKYPGLDLEIWIGMIALGIGFLGNSLWTNIMNSLAARANVKNAAKD